jgi:hypothetical protein
MWRWLISWLVWLSADPATLDLERARAAAAVAAARASLAVDAKPTPPAPGPKPPAPTPAVCSECGGKGYVVMPDGHRIACGACKARACPDGKCEAPVKSVLR